MGKFSYVENGHQLKYMQKSSGSIFFFAHSAHKMVSFSFIATTAFVVSHHLAHISI